MNKRKEEREKNRGPASGKGNRGQRESTSPRGNIKRCSNNYYISLKSNPLLLNRKKF